MILFFIGVIEMIIATLWTNMVAKAKILTSGVITFVNIFIWYYVLQAIVDDINNWRVIIGYALGCALGTVIATSAVTYLDKKRRQVRRALKKSADREPVYEG